ncbi:UbiB-like protein kinase [Chloropicon primus]|uniref:UbiB-like protein kinase n=1 Tax=Chloropicon primus TaxID=1764295 RepID=A0A5B8N212_9CHLO|nr:UbiB-like protein kinase [Chloropicon primus]UPR04959.1 UbiB-like protein kinase [Chloropicon primus]|eukprot:QDZ25764.1 UbiB-like protein kinase [Chloropicon primus]
MREYQAAAMEEDERVRALMENLRGKNLSDADFAEDDVEMRLVEVTASSSGVRRETTSSGATYAASEEDDDSLPLTYDPSEIASYWSVRPASLLTRITQLTTLSSGFLRGIVSDVVNNKVFKREETRGERERREVERAAQLRKVLTRLGPAYIKLGQALSIRPDLLSPVAMVELQKLCDKVPSFDSKVAYQVICDELGIGSVYDVFEDITPEPVAAASLGQVYIAHLKKRDPKTGGRVKVAVKVQRPYVLETVTIDLFIVRSVGKAIGDLFPNLKKRVDIVALLDEWAARFFEELDYVKEMNHTKRFAASMAEELPQILVPESYEEYTSRRVLVSEWIEGEKLAQSTASDVGDLVNLGVICYLKQLLEMGFFHADPHPGNMIRTPDGRLAILDFGLMAEIDNEIKYGMVEAISHLIHRDYEAIVYDFVTLEFIPPGTNLSPILPVLAKVFDQALEGGGAKSINFQELAADLAQITFDYPFRIPPYFALIIRAIGVLEGIALVGDPDFAIVDEAYPYLSKMLLMDESPRLRESLKYTIYGKEGVFDVDRVIDILQAFDTYTINSSSSSGDAGSMVGGRRDGQTSGETTLKFIASEEAKFFRNLLVDEIVKSIDALSRQQLLGLADTLGLQNAFVPLLVPGVMRPFVSITPKLTKEDEKLIQNIVKGINFLAANEVVNENSSNPLLVNPRILQDTVTGLNPSMVRDALSLANEVVPQITLKLLNRIAARAVRDVFVDDALRG